MQHAAVRYVCFFVYFAIRMSGRLTYLSIPQTLAPSHRAQVFIQSHIPIYRMCHPEQNVMHSYDIIFPQIMVAFLTQ